MTYEIGKKYPKEELENISLWWRDHREYDINEYPDCIEITRRNDTAANEIQSLKAKLYETDYMAIKYAEGFLSEAEYAPMRAERQQWRDRINELEVTADAEV